MTSEQSLLAVAPFTGTFTERRRLSGRGVKPKVLTKFATTEQDPGRYLEDARHGDIISSHGSDVLLVSHPRWSPFVVYHPSSF